MYKTAREASDYIEQLAPKIEGSEALVYLAVPYTSITQAVACAKQSAIRIGAQNMSDSRDGAFTGEIAALMLKEAGASFVILGHSERRHVFGESNEFIHRKVVRALSDGLQPVLCIGETLEERESGQTETVLKTQLEAALQDLPKEEAEKLILAYEPVWAIGTGKSATPEQAQEAHAFCRSCLAGLFGKRLASKIPILYGGSVKPGIVEKIVSQDDIDGVLVGGASLDPEMLSVIIHQCEGIK